MQSSSINTKTGAGMMFANILIEKNESFIVVIEVISCTFQRDDLKNEP